MELNPRKKIVVKRRGDTTNRNLIVSRRQPQSPRKINVVRRQLQPAVCDDEYQDMYEIIKANEAYYQPDKDFLKNQIDINCKMYTILMDWLVDVSVEYNLKPQTKALYTNYIQRFIGQKVIPRNELQLVGCACALIASKYEEIDPVTVDDLTYISDHSFKREKLIDMEALVLSTLKFDLVAPTCFDFMARFLRVLKIDPEIETLANYVCELSFLDCNTKYLPSQMALSSLTLALDNKTYNKRMLEACSSFKLNDPEIVECTKYLLNLANKADESNAVYRLYSDEKNYRVALIKLKYNYI